jgi:hypothetical protein
MSFERTVSRKATNLPLDLLRGTGRSARRQVKVRPRSRRKPRRRLKSASGNNKSNEAGEEEQKCKLMSANYE